MNKPNNFLECPFCGGQADASMPAGGKLAWVRCSNDKCFLSSIKYQHPTDWNTRMTQLNKYEPMTDKQRVAFEREYARRYGGGQFKQNRNDTYANYIVQEKWEMWQAALSQQPVGEEELAKARTQGYAMALANCARYEEWTPAQMSGGHTIESFKDAGIDEYDLKILQEKWNG
jgi:hypothetical protein